MASLQQIKQRFEIIGNDALLNRALEKAMRVAPTDISVLVTGESGVGKESFPKIIHALSTRKHAKYIAVNCGAIPEGTIDSELFGHEKGAFTGANTTRKGYFEVADGGTIFLDEVGELPLTTQVRLLRVLENGEFIKVGSSKVQKTDIRVVAATNLNVSEAIAKKKFRADLYYRLSTIEIELPALRKRGGDVHLLFRKFASDFGQKYQMPTVRLTEDAVKMLNRYAFPGNIRQLRNIAEQISIIEQERIIDSALLKEYLPHYNSQLPSVIQGAPLGVDFKEERKVMYNAIVELRKELNELKRVTIGLIEERDEIINPSGSLSTFTKQNDSYIEYEEDIKGEEDIQDVATQEVQLTLQEQEERMIRNSLDKNNGKRKLAADELGISERTLYRKIKQYNL